MQLQTGIYVCVLLMALASRAQSPVILHKVLDSGGGRSQSANYSADSSLGSFVGISSSSTTTARNGYIAQLNEAPVLTRNEAVITIGEGSPATNSGTFADFEGKSGVTLSTSVGIIVGNAVAGTWSWNFNTSDGPDQSQIVTITADDHVSSPVTTTFSLTVTNVPPTVQNQNVDTPAGTPKTITLAAVDPGNDTLTFAVTVDPAHGVLSGSPPNLTYTPATGYSGVDFFKFKGTDSDGAESGEGIVNIAVTSENTPPEVASAQATVMVAEGAVASNSGTFSDAEGNNTAVLSASVGVVTPAPAAGTWSWTFNTTDGPDQSQTVTITANDGLAPPVTTSFLLTVNNVAPVAINQNIETPEDIPKTITLVATDPGIDTLSFTVTTNPEHGALSGTPPNLTYTPTANYFGADLFKFKATDSDGAESEATINITILPENDAPTIANNHSTITVGEGSAAANSGIFSDVEGNATVTLSASVGSIVPDVAAGTWSWTFNTTDGPDQSQTVTITANDGTAAPVTTTFSLVVTNVPPTALDQTVDTSEDTPGAITLAAIDPGADTLTFTVTVSPAHGTLGGSSPTLTYTPAANYSGADSFKFKATDSDGAVSAEATISFNVSADNDPPVIDIDHPTVIVGEGGLAVNSGAFSDGDGNATVTLSASIGSVISNPAGVWTWSYNTTDGPDQSQTVTISANDGVTGPVIRTFSLTVYNLAPTPAAQNVTTPEDTPKSITIAATDPGTDTISFNITVSPAHGTLSGTPPNLIYTPAANYSGSDYFYFTATDSDDAESGETIVNITITPVNDPPVPGADSISRANNTRTARVLKTALLANDTDAELDPLTLTAVGSPTPAGATVAIAGTFVVYTSPATNSGNGSFTYTLNDGPGGHNVIVSVPVIQVAASPSSSGPNAVGIVQNGSDVIITFVGIPGRFYRVQYTTNLSAPYTWNEFNPLAILQAPPSGIFSYVDVAPSGPTRFYRAVPHP